MSTRVLHLIDAPEAGWPAFEALSALRRDTSTAVSHFVALIGGASAERMARDSGLEWDLRIAPALGRPELAAAKLRVLLRERDRMDVVHAWTAGSLTLGRLAHAGAPLCATLSAAPSGAPWSPWRIAALRAARRAQRMMMTSRFIGERWSEALGSRRAVVDMGLAPLPIRGVTPDPEARAQLRRRWGMRDDMIVVLAAGEPLERLDARWFTFRAGVLAVAGIPAAVVLPSRCDGLERAIRYTERHHYAWPLIVDDEPLRNLIHGCDLALWRAGPEGSGAEMFGAHGLAMCAGAGMPCVAEDHPISREVAAEFSSVRLVTRSDGVAMGRALFETVDGATHWSKRTPTVDSGDRIAAWCAQMNARLLRGAGVDAPYPESSVAIA